MAKKNSNNSSWECKHGCPVTKVPCKHLERKLNRGSRWKLSQEFIKENLDAILDLTKAETRSDTKIEAAMYRFGLQEFEVELMLDKYVANLSLREIEARHGYLSSKDVWRLIKATTEKLQKSPEFKELLVNLIKEKDSE